MQSYLPNLGLSEAVASVISDSGIKDLTPIQLQAIPPILAGQDVIGQAATGSGKTAAFSWPLLSQIQISNKELQALILVPTRELATQVVTEIRKWGRRLEGLQVLTLTGGQSGREQAESLERGVQIAVGTPGRLADLIDRRRLDLTLLKTVILDEADKMLEMGFEQELKFIMQSVPRQRQTLLFSATFPETIQRLSSQYQKNPTLVKVETTPESVPAIEVFTYEVSNDDKVSALIRVLQQHPSDSTIVFFNTKAAIQTVAERLDLLSVQYGALHGDLEQRDRERVMAMFRNGSYRLLLATDIAARGLDIEDLNLVVNFDFPQQADVFIHRMGRTGRAGKTGTAVLMADPRDTLRVAELEKAAKSEFKRVPLGFKNQFGLPQELKQASMVTLWISGGRKDKLRPGDIVGALTAGGAGLSAQQVGKIEVHDKYSFVAVRVEMESRAQDILRSGKIKGQKFQVKLTK